MLNTDPLKGKDKGGFNKAAFKHAIGMIESSGGKYLDSKYSSAAGKYHFLYNLIKKDPDMKGVSKRDFMNDHDLQEKIMDKAIDGKLEGYVGYKDYAARLKKGSNTNLSTTDLAALVHFLGPGGARDYINDPAGYNVAGKVNATPEKYLEKFRKYSQPQEKKVELIPSVYDNAMEAGPGIPEVEKDGVNINQAPIRNEVINNDVQGLQVKQSGDLDVSALQGSETKESLPEGIIPIEDQVSGGTPGGLRVMAEMPNRYAGGGSTQVTPNDSQPQVIEFNEGGSHEENPHGGIPIGMGSNGKMNTVEEGETMFEDYVFSNRFGFDGPIGGASDGANEFANGGDTDPVTNPKKEKVSKKEIHDIKKYIKKNSELRKLDPDKTANTVKNMFGNVGKYFLGDNADDPSLVESKYKPSVGGDKEKKYFTREGMREDVYRDLTSDRVKKDYNHDGTFEDIFKGLKSGGKDRKHNAKNAFPKNKAGYKGQYNEGHGSLKGQFNLGRYVTDAGEDERGRYISFSDTYDWNGLQTDNSIPFYDRIYEDEWVSNKNNEFAEGGDTNGPGDEVKEDGKRFEPTKIQKTFVGLSSGDAHKKDTVEYSIPRYSQSPRFTKDFSAFLDQEGTPQREAQDRFVGWYDDKATRKKISDQGLLDPSQVDDSIAMGVYGQIKQSDEVAGHGSAEYIPESGEVRMRDLSQKDKIQHELAHRSGFDATLSGPLMKILGNPHQQESKKSDVRTRRYLGMDHEAYGNFHEFRMNLGLKPGEKISKEEMNKRVKEKGLENNMFYRTFDDKKIIEAIDKVASTGKPQKQQEYRLA